MRIAYLAVLAGCGFNGSLAGLPADAPMADGRPDASGIDADPTSPLCFGSDGYLVCLPALPTAPLTLAGTSLDTGNGTCMDAGGVIVDPQTGGPNLCVLAGTTVSISGTVTATGDHPLVLIATGMLALDTGAVLDVSSHGVTRGAGADLACPPTDASGNGGVNSTNGSGGGAGGSFGTAGGRGGNGSGASGGTAAAAGSPTFVRGGCRGGRGGQSSGNGGQGGAGGGAVYLIARGALSISGQINASGGGGRPGSGKAGGGGGGAGGLIALYAGTTIALGPDAQLWANGGGGGGGADPQSSGEPGTESTSPTDVGEGGSGQDNGDGKDGAIGAGSGAPGDNGGKGGGGGGGGGGAIRKISTQSISGGTFSPPMT